MVFWKLLADEPKKRTNFKDQENPGADGGAKNRCLFSPETEEFALFGGHGVREHALNP